MKNLNIKVLTLGILATVVISSTPVFAATNNSTSNIPKAITTNNTISVSKTPTIPGTLKMAGSTDYWSQHMPVLSVGSTGDIVARMQGALNQGIACDGIFGSATRAAVIRVQRECNLVQDGIVGAQTWFAIEQNYHNEN